METIENDHNLFQNDCVNNFLGQKISFLKNLIIQIAPLAFLLLHHHPLHKSQTLLGQL